MIDKFILHMKVIVFFGLVAMSFSMAIYYIDRYFEEKYGFYYQEDSACCADQEDTELWIKAAVILQEEKTGKSKKHSITRNK